MTAVVLRKEEHLVDDPERLASCGRPVPWLRIALLDDDNSQVEDGEVGEICVRGPLVMKGYWQRPELTQQALAGDWLHTGDMAVRLRDGYLKIVDRKKDMIITGGFNVFAREVEDALGEHPAVLDSAVFGVPDTRWGETVVASVVLKADAGVDTDELIEFVKRIKGSVQAPKAIAIVESIPTTSLGKPDKKALKKWYIEEKLVID